jgi:hypothetical protein
MRRITTEEAKALLVLLEEGASGGEWTVEPQEPPPLRGERGTPEFHLSAIQRALAPAALILDQGGLGDVAHFALEADARLTAAAVNALPDLAHTVEVLEAERDAAIARAEAAEAKAVLGGWRVPSLPWHRG